MIKFYIYICTLLIIFVSCSKNENLNLTPPELPETIFFDLNKDDFDDIAFRFYNDDVVTDGTVGLVADVKPLNGTLLMVSKISSNSWILDSETKDIIGKEETQDYSWYPSNLIFMSIDDNPQGVWPDEWQLVSQKTDNPYYLVIQVKEDEDFLLGWLKLEINKETAKITIIDSEVTSEDSIAINR